MGLTKGTVSYRRFRLQDDLPLNSPEVFLDSIQKQAFRPIDGETDEEVSIGWVGVNDPLNTELRHEDLFFEDLVLLSMRIDKKRVPAKILSAHVQRAFRDYAHENDRALLSRSEKENIKEMVHTRLLRRVLPSMATYDMVLDLSELEVRFWSLSQNVCIEFVELFGMTFGLNLLPMSCYGLAAKLLDEVSVERLANLQPSAFVRSRGR